MTWNQSLNEGIQKLIEEFRSLTEITPWTVELFASLCLRTDWGTPIVPADHHRVWLDLITNESIKQLLILAPPESAKTTWILSAYVGCWVGFHPESNVIIGSSTASIAGKRSSSLRNLVESPMWRQLFPTVQRAEGMKWTDEEWSLAPEGKPAAGRLHPTLSAYGTGGSITGSRADLLVGDDLLDFENSRTPGGRETVKGWTHSSFLTRRKSGQKPGRTIIIGTMWNTADLYSSLKAQGDWVICRMPLLASERDDGYVVTLEYPDSWRGEILGEIVEDDRLQNQASYFSSTLARAAVG